MYRICPKCGHEGASMDAIMAESCSACGLIYSKWLKHVVAEPLPEVGEIPEERPPFGVRLRAFFFAPDPDMTWFELLLYTIIFCVFAAWGVHFISLDFSSNEIGRSFLHNINLVFHEAGHFFFMPLGQFMMVLGGSLFQVLVPLGLMGAFLVVNRDGFGASLGLWWTGQSLMDVAPYIADARALRLPLLGGGTGADTPGMHDWANILRELGRLGQDQQIAAAVDATGSVLVLLALAWGGAMLLINYRDIRSR